MTTKQPSFVFDGSHRALIRVFQIWQAKVIKEPPASNEKSERFLLGEKVNSWTGSGQVELPATKQDCIKRNQERVCKRDSWASLGCVQREHRASVATTLD